MNFIIISLSIIIIFLLFMIYRFLMSEKALVKNISLKSGHLDIALSKLKIKDYGNYNIAFWIYVNELPANLAYSTMTDVSYADNYGNDKHPSGCILQTSSNKLSLDLYSDNVLTFYNGRKIPAVSASVNPVVTAAPAKAYPSVLTNGFTIHKWTYIIVSVRNNTLVDLFMNGKLIQSSNYDGTTAPNKIEKPESTESLQFGKRLNALISKLYINPVAMDTNTAWNNYLAGNGSVSKMNVSFNLTQNGKISNKVEIL